MVAQIIQLDLIHHIDVQNAMMDFILMINKNAHNVIIQNMVHKLLIIVQDALVHFNAQNVHKAII